MESKIKEGKSYQILHNGELRKAHVMYILDGYYKDQKLFVFRYYGKYRQWWHHELLTEEIFTHAIKLA